ncbi:MAG TPA: hypothetical protein VES20_10110 [Bryobacteraceae bacterium]|nr:hypothetical protein [Bryobacteraceae bacterium]
MAAADNETIEEATKLAGDADRQITSSGHSQSGDGFSYNEQIEFRERKSLPGRILTRSLQRGDAVVIG